MIIYKTTNKINNKIYVGQDKYNNPNYLGSGLLLNRSINKYGKENFIKEIIDETNDQSELNEKEKMWIVNLNSFYPNGYNIAEGGSGGDVFTNNPDKESIRKKCSKPGEKNGMFGKHHKPESIEKMSRNRKGKGKGIPTWNKGLSKYDYSDEYRKKIEKQPKKYENKSNKTFIFTSPIGVEHVVHGNFDNFCLEHGLPIGSSHWFVGKGKINKPRNNNHSINRENLTGWEIKETVILS